ncbi:glucan endo-1,3-beta-glucosidase 3-like [Pyrus ussuriensis x Pyrus communis]|uniref:Glucan endo-1,3-beta-glucosidase 3-like n=1 Tax=Pyrus ussuriensis x Pyrus communis TaxID=2448454 RepID=A0A5N5H3B0_9ROSA|nr:glucan endo-1,3-beta-glucosidase 3-like [Pyrus ussuriensis x Pyrus communis]
MANAASKCLFLFFLSLLFFCSSGTLVGFSYHASGNTAVSSPGRTLSFLKQNKINASQIRVSVEDPRVLSTLSKNGVAVDLYLNERQVENIISSESSSKSWLKTHIMPFISQVDIKSIVAISGNDDTRKSSLPRVLSSLKTLHSILTSLPFDRRIKVSVAFSLSFLENLRRGNERDLHSICSFINEVRSVVIEANIDKELSMGDKFVRSLIEKAGLAHSVLTCSDVPMVLTIKSPAVPNTTEVAQFADKVSKALENETQIASRLVGLYAEVDCMDPEDFAQKELKREEEQIFPSSSRKLLSDLHPKTTSLDAYGSPTIFPTNSTPPLPTNSPYNSPNNVTVPATNPVTITPANPATPVEVSSSTLSPSNPVSPPLPVTTTPPTTNPATTYPPPPGGVPSTTPPVTNPVTPPATSNAPAVPGQSWCVAKSGAPQAALQAALDYACGMGGIDCSQIQQGGSCYDPNSLQNHASYAFNSYYQKHPVSTSCDFGGVATIVSANPSTGSCIYASSSSSSTPTTPTSNQTTTNPPPPSTIPPPPSTISPPTSPTPNQTTTNPPPPLKIPPPTSTIPPPTSTTPPPTPTRNQTTTNPPPTSTTPPPTLTIPPPTSTPPPAITSFPPPGEGVLGFGTPPSGLNSSNPAPSGTMPEFEPDSRPGFNTSISTSASLQPSFGCILFGTALVTRNIFLNM